MSIKVIAVLAAIAASGIGGCTMFVAGAAGALVATEMANRPPPGHRWCIPAGGGPLYACRPHRRGWR